MVKFVDKSIKFIIFSRDPFIAMTFILIHILIHKKVCVFKVWSGSGKKIYEDKYVQKP